MSKPDDPPAATEQPATQPTDSAEALVQNCLAEARQKQESGDLRGAFLTCQSLVIDHFGDIPEQSLAVLYGFMGKVSLLQNKQERAAKYLKKARALLPDDLEIKKLFHDVVETQERVAPKRKTEPKPAAPAPASMPPTLKTKLKPEPAEPEPEPARPEPAPVEPAASQPPPAAVSPKPPAQAGDDQRVWIAGFWSRVAAFLVDTLLVTFLVVLMTILSAVVLSEPGSSFATFFQQTSTLVAFVIIFTLMLLTYLTMFSIFGGQTAGKMLLGLKVVGLDGHSISILQALRRAGGMLLAGLPGLAGFFWTGFDLQRRGWHDYLGKTLVVYVRQPDGSPSGNDGGSKS